MPDHEILLHIQELLDGVEWTPDTLVAPGFIYNRPIMKRYRPSDEQKERRARIRAARAVARRRAQRETLRRLVRGEKII